MENVMIGANIDNNDLQSLSDFGFAAGCYISGVREIAGSLEFVKGLDAGSFSEVFAFKFWKEIQHILPGFEVPRTEGRNGQSYQTKAEGLHLGNYRLGPVSLVLESWTSMVSFDVAIGNTDRHCRNFLVNQDGTLIGIDHGLSLADGTGFCTWLVSCPALNRQGQVTSQGCGIQWWIDNASRKQALVAALQRLKQSLVETNAWEQAWFATCEQLSPSQRATCSEAKQAGIRRIDTCLSRLEGVEPACACGSGDSWLSCAMQCSCCG